MSKLLPLIVLVSILPLSACSTKPLVVQTYPSIPDNLQIRCPDTLPPVEDGKAGTLLATAVEWARIYHRCRVIHNGLVTATQRIEAQSRKKD